METRITPTTLVRILGAGSINFALISLGYSLGHKYGFDSSVLIFLKILPIIGLAQLIAITTASIRHQNSIQLCTAALGSIGAITSTLIILTTTLLWFGFNLVLIQKNICLMLGQNLTHPSLLLGEVTLIFLIFCIGIHNISGIITIQASILLIICIKLAIAGARATKQPIILNAPYECSISLLALLLPSIVDLPTWYAHLHATKKAIATQLLVSGFCTPATLTLGLFIGSHSSAQSFLAAIANDRYGYIGNSIFISSAILGNSTALFMLSQLLKKKEAERKPYQNALICALLGYFIALLPYWENIETTIKITGAASSGLAVMIILACLRLLLCRTKPKKDQP